MVFFRFERLAADRLGGRTDPVPRLERWMIVPADEGFALAGEIHDDARFAPGLTIVTSPVLAVDARAGTARTPPTAYRLGRPSPKFAGWPGETSDAGRRTP